VGRSLGMGVLRPGLSPGRALDIIRAVNTLEAYIDLTWRRGWTVAQWKAWLNDPLAGQLLGAPASVLSAPFTRAPFYTSNIRLAGVDLEVAQPAPQNRNSNCGLEIARATDPPFLLTE
jgi:hypothetical protein